MNAQATTTTRTRYVLITNEVPLERTYTRKADAIAEAERLVNVVKGMDDNGRFHTVEVRTVATGKQVFHAYVESLGGTHTADVSDSTPPLVHILPSDVEPGMTIVNGYGDPLEVVSIEPSKADSGEWLTKIHYFVDGTTWSGRWHNSVSLPVYADTVPDIPRFWDYNITEARKRPTLCPDSHKPDCGHATLMDEAGFGVGCAGYSGPTLTF